MSSTKVVWTQRTDRGGTFRRWGRRGTFGRIKSTVVLNTPNADFKPWEARLDPGVYALRDVVAYPDIKKPIPKHAKFYLGKSGKWKSSGDTTSGTLELQGAELRTKEIPVEFATDPLLSFYGCSLIGEKTAGKIKLFDQYVIQDFAYSESYFEDYVAGVGTGVETHEFAHVDCPLSPIDESGVFLLGKVVKDEDYAGGEVLCLTAFRVPTLHALYVPGGTVHSNDYLRGTWRTMLSWTSEETIDHVTLSSNGKKAYFNISGFTLPNPDDGRNMLKKLLHGTLQKELDTTS